MIIDFHTHTFPDRIAENAISALEKSAGIPAFTDGTADGLISSMHDSGVDLSVVLPVVTNPEKTEKINRSAEVLTHTKEGIISFGGVHPLNENYKQILKDICSMGLKGIKLHPEFQYTDFDDISYLRIIDHAEELGLITLTHAGFDGSFPGSKRCYTKNILAVLEQVRPKHLVLAHMGGHSMWDDVKKYIAGADVYLDTALSFGRKQKVPNLLSSEDFTTLATAHGTDKILFATDSPWSEQKEMVDFVKATSLTDEQKSDILGNNAVKLLK
jgi:hypothetical protein